MQNGNFRHYADRSLFYGGRLVNSSLENGEARFAQLTAKLLSEGLVDELMRCTKEPAYKEELYKKFKL